MVWWFRAIIPDFYHIMQNVKWCEFHGNVHEFHDLSYLCFPHLLAKLVQIQQDRAPRRTSKCISVICTMFTMTCLLCQFSLPIIDAPNA
jgi:hypothetical protein